MREKQVPLGGIPTPQRTATPDGARPFVTYSFSVTHGILTELSSLPLVLKLREHVWLAVSPTCVHSRRLSPYVLDCLCVHTLPRDIIFHCPSTVPIAKKRSMDDGKNG